jgi:hypothetical protein
MDRGFLFALTIGYGRHIANFDFIALTATQLT